MTIKNLKTNETGTIISLNGKTPIHLRLLDMGFTPNTKVTVKKIAPLSDPIQLHLRGYDVIIRKEDAEKIYIQKEKL